VPIFWGADHCIWTLFTVVGLAADDAVFPCACE